MVPFEATEALEAGLVSFAPDELDWDDEVRLAIESRAAFSPDALTGLEANLRFAGPETMETKIFGRLTAWQNWIFQRPNAVARKARSRPTARRSGGPNSISDACDRAEARASKSVQSAEGGRSVAASSPNLRSP